MTDLDRLLELAEQFKRNRQSSGVAAMWFTTCDPDTIIELIERVKEAEREKNDEELLDFELDWGQA